MKRKLQVLQGLLISTAFVSIDAVAQVSPGIEPNQEVTTESQEGPDDIVVTGRRAADRAALENKRLADGQIDQVRADDVGRLPDQNVAESLRRLPGLSVANDQGDQESHNKDSIGRPDFREIIRLRGGGRLRSKKRCSAKCPFQSGGRGIGEGCAQEGEEEAKS